MENKRKIFEVATWPCSEEYVKNPSIINPAFDLLTGPEGPSGLTEIFYGIEVGKWNACAVLNWDSIEAHAKFTADQDATLKFVKMFESSTKDGIPNGTIIHASWEEDAALACLKAPFLELKKITPKEGTTTQAIHDALDKYVARMNKASSRAAYGHVIEEPEKLMIALGSEGGTESEGMDIGEIAEVEEMRVCLKPARAGQALGPPDNGHEMRGGGLQPAPRARADRSRWA